MYKLTYGNIYEQNTEYTDRECTSDADMETAALDFLQSVECAYENDGELPDDWYSSIFWERVAE